MNGVNGKESKGATESTGRMHFIAVIGTVIGALLAFSANVITTFMNNRASIQLEERKFESTLIVEATQSGSVEKAAAMLKFYVDSGLIEDRSGEIRKAVKENRVPILARRGKPYDAEFIDSLFSEWKSEQRVDHRFRAILVETADDILRQRWHRLATQFAPDYYAEQLTLLSKFGVEMSGDGIVSVMKRMVSEALHSDRFIKGGVGQKRLNELDLSNVIEVKYLRIVEEDEESPYPIIKMRLYLNDGTSLVTGYWFSDGDYYFHGAFG